MPRHRIWDSTEALVIYSNPVPRTFGWSVARLLTAMGSGKELLTRVRRHLPLTPTIHWKLLEVASLRINQVYWEDSGVRCCSKHLTSFNRAARTEEQCDHRCVVLWLTREVSTVALLNAEATQLISVNLGCDLGPSPKELTRKDTLVGQTRS